MLSSSICPAILYYAFAYIVVINLNAQWAYGARPDCGLFQTKTKKNDSSCSEYAEGGAYHNIPILNGVYCFNNGTGICKAFAGRFEFYFNVWTQTFLGPVEKSQHVDSFGYHERVPHSYMIDGSVLYADRPINWSIYFTRNKPTEYNLLSSTSFNWCKYVTSNNWPYTSSFLDHNKRHQIYFFNRQSCIYDPVTRDLQHYNTRFLHKSQLRIDLDYNPTIFAMEDNLAKEIRLVKHKRQHWYEVRWKLLENPQAGLKYFIEMSTSDEQPLIVDGKGPLLRRRFYDNTTDICVSDYYTSRELGKVNNKLVPGYCGLDQGEIADYILSRNKTYEVDLHSIPRTGLDVEEFYGVDVNRAEDWEKWAKDGFSFSATTTIPTRVNDEGDQYYDVVSLFSYYKGTEPSQKYDEHYPPTYLCKYLNRDIKDRGWIGVHTHRKMNDTTKKINLNYVDDIAYLYKCKTILVIFGPLYTEFKVDQFNLETKTPLGSIYDLGLNEMTSAFFAMPNENRIYFLHRLNFIAEHSYTCGSPLVTAKKVADYRHKIGTETLPIFAAGPIDYNHQEERHFALLGMFKGSLGKPDAPDVKKYSWDQEDSQGPDAEKIPNWIWVLVVIFLAILVVMLALGYTAFRQQRRKRYLAKTLRSELPNLSQLPGEQTHRSNLVSGAEPPSRGGLDGNGISIVTIRSDKPRSGRDITALSSSPSSSLKPSSAGTRRSSMPTFSKPSTTGTRRSGNIADKTKSASKRSQMSGASKTSRSKGGSLSSKRKRTPKPGG